MCFPVFARELQDPVYKGTVFSRYSYLTNTSECAAIMTVDLLCSHVIKPDAAAGAITPSEARVMEVAAAGTLGRIRSTRSRRRKTPSLAIAAPRKAAAHMLLEELGAWAWVMEASTVAVAAAELVAVRAEVAEVAAARAVGMEAAEAAATMAAVGATAAEGVPEEMAVRVEHCCTRLARWRHRHPSLSSARQCTCAQSLATCPR